MGQMKKNTLKYVVDAALFIDISAVSSIGLLLAFVIPAGRADSSAKYFLGLHRHQWGDIHLYLSILLMFLLVFHLWSNWNWIIHSTRRYFGEHWKHALWGFAGAWLIVLLIAWMAAH